MIFKTTAHVAAMLILLVANALPQSALAAAQEDKSTVAEIQQETRELLQALKTYSAAQRDEAMQKIKTAQKNLDRRIKTLEQSVVKNWDVMDQAAREKSNASLQALRQQRTRVAELYGSLKSSSTGAWGHIKEGFSSAYGALHNAWEKTEKEFADDK